MEDIEQPRRIGGFPLAVALLLAAAATWAAVALASGSAASPDSSVPAVTNFGSDVQTIASPGDGDPNCPHDDGDSTTPSSPSTPSTPSDGSSSPTL